MSRVVRNIARMPSDISPATKRALKRVAQGNKIRPSALEEGINPNTLFRALARRRDDQAHAPRMLIAGAGALGRELANWIRRDKGVADVAFLDDGLGLTEAQIHARGIVGAMSRANVRDDDELLIAVADPAARARLVEMFEGLALRTYIDASCVVGDPEIGAGSLLLPFALVSDGTKVGRSVIINTYSSIGHDCTVGDFCTFSSYVALCGRVRVGSRAFFGVGAKVLPGVTIGDGAVIGAGAVVVKDVQAGATVFGNPARRVS